jgi:asparagine synthase (glutamine-hydrolysing)
MCGICGVWGGEGREAVGAMVAAMHHRGPDDRGVLFDGSVALGMTRLAIIDISSGGHQPMQTPDGNISVVYNGELYNFQSERRLLEKRGYTFASSSDTEVVLRMYEHYGDDFLLRMRGMFALAVYDKRRGPGRERLLLARDQMGIKPLLYARVGPRLVFASELKALLASELVEPEIDPISLRMLLTYGSVYQPRTILRGVRSLLPAHRMTIEGGRERVERYWSLGLDRHDQLRRRTYHEQVEEVESVLAESVRLQMIADVPLGAFLSGGIDSALLVALMARYVGGRRVKTFSVGFEAEGEDLDESDDAERTARHIGTDHSRVVVRGADVREHIRHIARGLDQPSVDGVNSYFVSLAARRGVTVAISGTGGDELFAGYPWFATMAHDETRAGAGVLKGVARAGLASVARRPFLDSFLEGRGGQRLSQLRRAAGFRARYAHIHYIFGVEGAARVIAPEWKHSAQALRSPHYDLGDTDELPRGTVLERVTGLCLRGYTANQLLRDIDSVSMAHSLEVRVPFLDPVVADAALSLPDAAKMGTPPGDRAGTVARSYREAGTKRVLLDIGKKYLPEGFDTKPKRGFAMPFDSWLKGPLRDVIADALSAEQTKRRGLFSPRAVAEVVDGFFAGTIDWPRPWLLMMFELWAREVLDRAPGSLSHAAEHAFKATPDACETAA